MDTPEEMNLEKINVWKRLGGFPDLTADEAIQEQYNEICELKRRISKRESELFELQKQIKDMFCRFANYWPDEIAGEKAQDLLAWIGKAYESISKN